jgi:hypothetical protein
VDNEYQIDLKSLKKIVLQRLQSYLVFTGLFSGLSLVMIALFVQKQFEYVVVFDIGSNKVQGVSDLLGGSAAFGKKSGPSGLVAEVIEYIELQYIKNPKFTEDSNTDHSVYSVENIENTDQITIKVRAESLEASKSFAFVVLKEVIAKFQDRIMGMVQYNRDRIQDFDRYAENIKKQIIEVEEAQSNMGLNAGLIDRKAELTNALLKIQSEKNTLVLLQKSGNIRPMKLILSRPTSYHHVTPKFSIVLIFLILTAALGCLGHAILESFKHREQGGDFPMSHENTVRKIS